MVPILYCHLLSLSKVMRFRFPINFNTFHTEAYANIRVPQIVLSEENTIQRLIMDGYRCTRHGTLSTEHMGGPIPEHWTGLQIYL